MKQQEAALGELLQQQEEVRNVLGQVRIELAQEQRERAAVEEAMQDARESSEAKAADAEERERRLAGALEDVQAERKRIEKEGAAEKASFDKVLAQLGGEQAEVNRKNKEAEERAIEFEKQWVAESKLRKVRRDYISEIAACRVSRRGLTHDGGHSPRRTCTISWRRWWATSACTAGSARPSRRRPMRSWR